MSTNADITRKHRNSFDVEDLQELVSSSVKRVKDSELSDTSSEDTVEENRLQRMAGAMKTIIEVESYICNFFIITERGLRYNFLVHG